MKNAAAKAEADRMQMYVDLAAAEAHAQSLRDAEAAPAPSAAVELAEAEKVTDLMHARTRKRAPVHMRDVPHGKKKRGCKNPVPFRPGRVQEAGLGGRSDSA